jgi:hypothetical protein
VELRPRGLVEEAMAHGLTELECRQRVPWLEDLVIAEPEA